MNKYKNYSDRRLLQEVNYMVPWGDPRGKDTIDTVQSFNDTDMMHLLLLIEAMADRIEES